MVLNLIFLGPPGAGKGTVAQAVLEKHSLVQISTGDLIRAEISSGSDFGKKLLEITSKGMLVSDSIVGEMLKKELAKVVSDKKFTGVIFDGFPRTINQAQMLESILKDVKQSLNAVIYIESSKENVVKRISARWTCPICKKAYNTLTIPSKKPGVCDTDGAKLIQREDDKAETVSMRYDIFIEKTMPLIDYYTKKGLLIRYDGNVSPEESIKAAERIISGLN